MNSLGKLWLIIFAGFFQISATTSAAPYVVEGYTLGARALDNPSYRSYQCNPSTTFEGFTWCERTQQKNRNTLFTTIMHDDDGSAIYVMANLAPVSVNRSTVQAEIETLSKEIKERPTKIDWFQKSGLPTSVIAIWGKIELQKLKPDELERVATGDTVDRALLVDFLGDLARSAKSGLPVYRISGGAGYLYAASFDQGGRGHLHYVTADTSKPAIKTFESELRKIVEQDQSLVHDDYSLWPKIAVVMRNISLQTGPTIANEVLDKVYVNYSSKKLRSRVWSLLPLGSIKRLANHKYWTNDTYGPQTGYPEIRRDILKFLAGNRSEPFIEFLYYTIGDFERAINVNPNSIIGDVIQYASGYKIIESLVASSARAANIPPSQDDEEPVNTTLRALNLQPKLEAKLIGSILPSFAARAATAQPFFENVLRYESSPLADDAAYMLGWLAFHRAKFKEALQYMSRAMTLGNGDYTRPAALKETTRILSRFSPQEQVRIVESDAAFSQQSTLWYFAARSAYREFDFPLAISCAERGLTAVHIPLDRLPSTTDPEEIGEALGKINPQGRNNEPNDKTNDLEVNKAKDLASAVYDGLYDEPYENDYEDLKPPRDCISIGSIEGNHTIRNVFKISFRR
jgi:hypothetical protein